MTDLLRDGMTCSASVLPTPANLEGVVLSSMQQHFHDGILAHTIACEANGKA